MMPFVRRADEVEKTHPRVAYYTRVYAVEQGMKKGADKSFLVKVSASDGSSEFEKWKSERAWRGLEMV